MKVKSNDLAKANRDEKLRPQMEKQFPASQFLET
jgi:hypothetical protein